MEVWEQDTPAGRPARRGLFLLMYSPTSRILELWSLVHGPLLKSWALNAALYFIPSHYENYRQAFKRCVCIFESVDFCYNLLPSFYYLFFHSFNAIFILESNKLFGVRASLDLWFPHTSEAEYSRKFHNLRSWISSRTFRRALKSSKLVIQ